MTTNWYTKLTPAQKARFWTLLVTGLTTLASVGDKIHTIPWLPGWFVNAWPVILSVDMALLKLISIFTNPNAPQTTTAP